MKSSKGIRYQWTNLRAEVVGSGQGLTPADLDSYRAAARAAVEKFTARIDKGEFGFAGLPFDKKPVGQIERYARACRGRYRSILLLGIGGSALGPFALDAAVNGPRPFRRKKVPAELWVLDNVDPLILGRALEQLDPRQTLVLVVTKSGSTAETMAQFLIVYAWLRKKVGAKKAARQVAAVTDPAKGDLLDIARREGFELFAVPPNVGGRFSVLSPVGLLPAALVGVNIKKLLAGAGSMIAACRQTALEANPALEMALHQYLLDTRYRKTVQAIYCYSNALWPLAFWYKQLWAESLGKQFDRRQREVCVGQTVVSALGVTDQHSQSQLYMEGPRDKVIVFWEVERDAYRLRIPPLFPQHSSTDYLGGHTLNELFRAEKFATELAFTEAGRPNATVVFPRADEYSIGQFMMLAEFATAYAGEFYDVNAFDQPGVELGKQLTYALLGRKGFDAERRRIASYRKQNAALTR
ncbi:MAG: glucose-6-phosphate isomerase [Candidatus Acidiferrales bacterium]